MNKRVAQYCVIAFRSSSRASLRSSKGHFIIIIALSDSWLSDSLFLLSGFETVFWEMRVYGFVEYCGSFFTYYESSHYQATNRVVHLQVIPLTTASHATNYSKSSRSSSASHSIIYIESYHSSSACQSIHPLQVIHHLQDSSLSLLEGLLDAFLGQEQVMHRVSTPFSRYKTSLQFQIQLPVFVSFLPIFIKTRAIRDQVTSNEL